MTVPLKKFSEDVSEDAAFARRVYISTDKGKSVETINEQAKALIKSTGYDEVSLCSLSTSDHSRVNEMLTSLIDWTVKEKSISHSRVFVSITFQTNLRINLTRSEKAALPLLPRQVHSVCAMLSTKCYRRRGNAHL